LDLSLVVAAFKIDWAYWGFLAQGILALGLVIFIHEFGHFAAAKLCGVKVEKFYVGFDPYGLKLFSFRWGETEYGIGAVPLGGYVYMLGQTDNPGKQAEEAERAKAQAADGKPVDPEAAAVWDPRSYPAQSVPERMLIISAGVIMNAITAFLFAVGAYLMGVQYTPTIVGSVSPGGPAWERDIRAGDVITKIDYVTKPRFGEDMMARVMLSDLDKGLEFRVDRPVSGEFTQRIHPRQTRKDMTPAIGMSPSNLTKLNVPEKPEDKFLVTASDTPARKATPAFEAGDEFIKVGEREIRNAVDLAQAFVEYSAREALPITVRRNQQELTIDVARRPSRTLGLVMEAGPIAGVQDGSPAAKAGLKAGDRIKSIDGEPLGDPATAPERLRRKQKEAPEKPWKVVVERTDGGSAKELTFDIVPVTADRVESPNPKFPYVSVPTIGIAYTIAPNVTAVVPGSPAEKAGLKAGDKLVQVVFVPSDKPLESGKKATAETVKLTENDVNMWPVIIEALSSPQLPGDLKLEITKADKQVVTLEPVDSTEFFEADRGFIFQPIREMRKAENLSQAMNFAWIDTRDNMTQVYRFLHAMWIGQIPTNNVGGIITIADQAGRSASGGLARLLLFLTMLSCNLAVLNFLPFPVLDGGHMVLLTYEAIFRRPPPERFVGYLNLFGLVCLLFLMGYALKNDIFRLAGWN
jgi:regulator of sigma E protease